MDFSVRETIEHAFNSPQWTAVADALFQATGVIASVMDFERHDLVSGRERCSYCRLATALTEIGPLECFDTCPAPDAGPGRMICRAGLSALYSPIMREDQVVAHMVLTGHIGSSRERHGLFERLVNRGVGPDNARRTVKSLPIISRGQAEGYLQMALASAQVMLDASAEQVVASKRLDDLRLFVSAGRQLAMRDRLDAKTLSDIADEAAAIVGGEAAAVLRPCGADYLEVIGRTGGWRGPVGALVPNENTVSGRAVVTQRAVVSRGRSSADKKTLAVPISADERVVGVIEVRLSGPLTVAPDAIARLGRFGQFVAIAFQREDERTAVDRALGGYTQLNELATSLGGRTDIESIVQLVLSVFDKAYPAQLCGMIITGWGRDRADLMLNVDASQADIDDVLGVVSGRDSIREPFAILHTNSTNDSRIVEAPSAVDWAVCGAELRFGDLDVGWLFASRADGGRYGRQDHALIEAIAGHAGAALGRAAQFSSLRDDYAKTIATFSATLDMREHANQGHAGRVMEYATLLGKELGLNYEQVEQLRFAGLLHDIGKVSVPEEILVKPKPLTSDESEIMRRHSEKGATIVEQIDFLKALKPIILHHHERWDGKGYPAGLNGPKIPILARALAVADAFDAMTMERSYRKKKTIQQARLELEKAAGTQFDPRVVAAMLTVLDREATVGSMGLFGLDAMGARPELLS